MSTQTFNSTKPRLPRWMTAFGPQVIAALIVGVLLGLVAKATGSTADDPNALGQTLQIIGSSYVSLLRTAVIPLIFFAIIASIANLSQVSNAARLAWKTLLWFAITALIAVVIGIALGTIFQPGVGTGQETPAGYDGGTGSWLGFLQGLIPSNFLGLDVSASFSPDDQSVSNRVSFNVLQIIVIAIAVGVATLKIGAAAEPFLSFARSTLAIIQKVLWWIIRLAPLGTIGLLGNATATYGWDTIGALGKYTAAIYVGLALVLFVVYPVLLKVNGLSFRKYFAGAWPAIQLAFVSRSSVGTLPLSQRVTERNLGVPGGYASFAVPLGATTKMDGCAAIYPAISAIFVAQFFNVDLNVIHYLLIVLVSVVGSAATAGTTGATVMLTLTLTTVGLPLEGVALLLAVDPILDMGRTAVNVAGQILVPTLVAKREGILDQGTYNAANPLDPFEEDDAVAPANAESAADAVGESDQELSASRS